MWHPIKIRIKNLFTHSDTSYNFKQGEMSVFIGQNKDRPASNSNGSGKSSLIEGVRLALIAEVMAGISPDKFIKRGQESCEVELELQNDILNKKLEISRIFFKNKSSQLLIVENGIKRDKTIGVAEGNKYILSELGISKEDLENYFIIGQGNDDKFFTAGDAKQKEIIGRFCNYSILDKLSEQLSKNVLDNEIKDRDAEISMVKIQTIIDSYKEEIEQLLNNESDDEIYKNNLAKSNIKDFEIKIKESISFLKTINKELIEKENELNILSEKQNKEKLIKLKKDKEEAEEIQYELSKDLEKIKSKIKNINLSLGDEIECPKCEHQFIPASEFSINELNIQLKKCIQEEINLKDQIKIVADKIAEISISIKKEKDKKEKLDEEIETKSDEVEEIKKSIKRTEKDKIYYENKIIELNEELTTDKKDIKKEKIKNLRDKIKIQKNNLQPIIEQREEIQKEIEKNKRLIFHFGKSGFKTYLSNISIKHIQDITNYYLQKFETGLQVRIKGFTVLKSGEAKDKINIQIIEDSIQESDYKQCSGGERVRVDVGCILALNSLVNNSCEYGKGFGAIFLDEISYLDAGGQVEILNILEKVGITTILIMHNIDDIPVKNKVIFIKEKKNTTIKIL